MAKRRLACRFCPAGSMRITGRITTCSGWRTGCISRPSPLDPSQPAPEYPRWFGLDDEFTGRRGLDKWILRCDDIAAAQDAFPEAGTPVHLTRGDLSWSMLVPPTGVCRSTASFPAIIQWHTDTPPGMRLPAAACAREVARSVGSDVAESENAPGARCSTDDRVVFEAARADDGRCS